MHLPHLITISDLFANYDVRKLKGDGNIKRKYKCEDKKALAKKIFLRYLHILLLDMIEGDKTFLMPSMRYLEMRWRLMRSWNLQKAIQAGAFKNLDILMSQRKCYELMMTFRYKGHFIEKHVKLSENYMNMMIDKVNTGYKYC